MTTNSKLTTMTNSITWIDENQYEKQKEIDWTQKIFINNIF